MDTNTTTAISNLASFEKMQRLVTARSGETTPEAGMTFEEFEVELSRAARELESELKAMDLARYDVEAEVVLVDGSHRGTAQPVPPGRQGQEHLPPGTPSRHHRRLLHPGTRAAGLVHDGAHDLG